LGKGNLQLFGRLQVLNEEEIESLHQATLRVLEQIGIRFEEERSREILRKAGAKVDGKIVRFPAKLVNELIKLSPKKVVLGARNADKSITLGETQILFTNGYGATQVVDIKTREYRKATLKDLKNFIRLCDFLNNIDYCLDQVIPQDVPPPPLDLIIAFVMLNNTEKNVHLSMINGNYIEEVIELGEIVSDRKNIQESPVYSLGCCPISPLTYPANTTDRLRKAVKRNIPFLIVSGATAGATAPVTLAGTLIVQNSEILAGIMLAQAISPGAPIVYGSFASPMDMSRGKQLLGVPEIALMNAATAQLCKRYRIPFGYGTGGITDSFISGVQAGFEKGSTILLGALGGVEVIHDGASGMLGSSMIASYEQLILDDEFCNIIKRYLKGINISEEAIAFDVIKEVGPGGDFLRSTHTVQNLRKELYLSRLWNRDQVLDEIKKEQVIERAAQKAKEILNNHKPIPLSEDKLKEMIMILEKAGFEGSKELWE
jgi:trimethylamine--corrinoid protein Co-methyltransferase